MYGSNPYMTNNPYQLPNYLSQVQTPAPQPQVTGPKMSVPTVTGEESARAFSIGPDSSVILLDTSRPMFWLVITDSSGYKTIKPYDFTEHVEAPPVTPDTLSEQMARIDARLAKLEERMNGNGQSNHGTSWKNKPGNANGQSNGRSNSGSQGSSSGDSANGAE